MFTKPLFTSAVHSHQHSLTILNDLQQYDEFMESIQTMVDLGCGTGLDLEWWATRTTRDENPQPLNIKCMGVDLNESLPIAHKYENASYQRTNFEKTVHPWVDQKFDVLWCHDSFQYAIDPIGTLKLWRDISSPGCMLALAVPQTTNLIHNRLSVDQLTGVYHHYTMVNLMHMLAVTGWDCNTGYFRKQPNEPWITAIVYKSDTEPMDPGTTSWYELAERKLLPESAVKSINAHGYLRQEDLLIEWLDHSLAWMGKQ